MKLDVKRQLFARSERVKGIDFHPTEPWVCCQTYLVNEIRQTDPLRF